MKVRKIKLNPILSDEETADLAGVHLSVDYCKHLYTENVDVYCAQSGKCLAKFRKGVIPKKVQKSAYENLKGAAPALDNRGVAAGWDEELVQSVVKREGALGYVRDPGSLRFRLKLKDGTISKTNRAVPVNSGVIGYMDRNPRFPNCRQTAFNQKHFDKFKRAYPIIKCVDNLYAELMPKEYALQRSEADRTSKDYVIKNTAFTTVTVNSNWQTAVHTDKGDFEQGFGNLVALRAGEFKGGYFVLPKWGFGFDLRNGDILLADVHQWHGNTPIIKVDKGAVRLSLVMYYRKNMIYCGTADQELEIVKNRKRGQKING